MLNQGYETFEHTADIGVRAWAQTMDELFEGMAKALFSVMCDLSQVNEREQQEFDLSADNEEELLMAWLKELLFVFDTKRYLFSRFKVRLRNERELSAVAWGELLDVQRHDVGQEVKAVTRHQFVLTKNKEKITAQLVLDI